MKARGKKLLAAMLSLAMVLSMFVAPASAADLTGAINDIWEFKNAPEADNEAITAYMGLTLTNAVKYNTKYVSLNANGTVTIPVAGPCDVCVSDEYGGGGTVGVDTDTVPLVKNGTAVYNYKAAGTGFVTVSRTTGSVYLTKIEIKAHNADPALKLDKESVVVKMGQTATVTPTVENPGSETYTITAAASDGEATVAATVGDGNAITIDPKAAGKTTVTVTATPGSGEALTATVAVRVPPTEIGTVTENQTVTYRGSKNEALADKYYVANGLEWGTDMTLTNDHGPYASNPTLKVHIPTDTKTTLTVTTCCYGNGGTPTVTGGELAEPIDSTEVDGQNIGKIFTINNAEGTVTIAFTGTTYIHEVKVGAFTSTGTDPEPEPDPQPEPGNGKVDVYDFGAEQLDTEKFNNKLTVDVINGWYSSDVTAGSVATSNTLGDFSADGGALSFNAGGKTNHRLRTTNTAITRYDEKSKKGDGKDPYVSGIDDNPVTYNGYIYDNAGSGAVDLSLKVNKGDVLTYIVGSNGNPATYTLESPSGVKATGEFDGKDADTLTFYPAETGAYKLYTLNEKLVVARAYRERPTAVTVSGALTIDSSLADATGLKLIFTNDDSGIATEATISGSTYTATLSNYQAGTSYTVTAGGITGGVVLAGKALALTGETGETATHPVTVGQVNLVNVSGSVTGLNADSLGRLKLTLTPPEGNIYVPEVTLTSGAWSAQLQSGIEYAVSVENVNDYTLNTTTVKKDADATDADIAFTAKPTHAITIVPTGLTLAELADATFTFTNIAETYVGADGKEASYAYTFTGPDAIALRDGQYTVKVETGKGRQELTPDLKVKGAAANCPVGFDVSVPTKWDFSAADFTDAKYAVAGDKTYNGLLIGNGLKKETGKAHVSGGSGTIRIPVTGDCAVNVSVYYAAAGTVGVGSDTVALETTTSTNTTNTTDTITYDYTGEAGYADVTVTGTTYITKIETIYSDSVEFKDTVTVGEGKDCATIGEALELAAKMPRPNGERVTIVIDPGDYEEQLWVDVDNVTLKNAKADAAKLELKDKGVGIGDNDVRITHYYGHGYTYYSMTTGHRYDEKVLAVNKANGYASYVNKGTGTTDNSYWNASVVVAADGFQAEGIIFENSFNQYVSAKAANDVIEKQSGGKEPASAPRADQPQGSTAVQDKTYVERAAALAITGDKAVFDNCAFISRQDTLYGGVGTKAAFYNCDVYGGTDYIFGGMNAVFAKCDLVLNTSENKNDVAYITAGQQASGGRGYLMYNCSVISTVPGVNTASKLPSKPGMLGRAWSNDCEAVFYETIVDSTTTKADGTQGTEEVSLIQPEGWKDGLGGKFDRCAEYHTHEIEGTTPNRLAPAKVLETPTLVDGTAIDYKTWLGGWKPFEGKDMTVVGCPDTSRTVTFQVDTGASVTDLAEDGAARTLNSKNQLLALKEAVVTFKIDVSEGYTLTKVTGATWDDESVYTVTADTVVINAKSNSSSSGGGGGDNVPTGGKTQTTTNPDGSKTTTKTDRKGNVTVTTKSPDGSKVETYTTKDGDKTITVTDVKGNVQAKVELPAAIPAPEKAFTDVPEGHWAESAIRNMAGLGTVKGVSDGVYDMSSPITRGSVATILYRLSNVESKGDNAFADVDAGDWYAEAVTWATATGVVTGYSETAFGPKDPIDRQQFAVMLYRYAKLLKLDTTTEAELKQFQDAGSVADWAAKAMSWCVGEGIVKGNGYGSLNPAGTASRAECAVMLDRFIGLL